MKKNIGILTVIATLTLGSVVFANSPQKPNEIIETTVESDTFENTSTLEVALPKEYMTFVEVVPNELNTLEYDINIEGNNIGKVIVLEDKTIEFIEAEEIVDDAKINEITKYIVENQDEVFKYTDESVVLEEGLTSTIVYNGSGYAIEMPKAFEEEIMVISTRSNPPQLIFNYTGDEEVRPMLRLEIVRGEYNGENEVIKSGNGYSFAVEFVEYEEETERFIEIQNYFIKNTEDLVVLALDYNSGNKSVVINGTQVGEYITTGEGQYMIPLRTVSESLGMDVLWNNETKTIDVTNGKLTIQLKIGEKEYSVNKSLKKFEQEPMAIDGTTYVPLSFINDAFGLQYNIGNGALVIS